MQDLRNITGRIDGDGRLLLTVRILRLIPLHRVITIIIVIMKNCLIRSCRRHQLFAAQGAKGASKRAYLLNNSCQNITWPSFACFALSDVKKV